MNVIRHQVDLCVVGGGMAGLSAAITAARHGARTLLMQERPVLGGNASSEIRMWVCGARGENQRETGLIEEIRLDNLHRNPNGNWSIWDSILYEKARSEPNLTLLLNCSCVDATMDQSRIQSIKGWQMTTQSWHVVESPLFADCSGDSILAPLSGAEVRWGRESASEFGEDIAPAQADNRTMGMSCLIQAREMQTPQPFVPPPWAHIYRTDDELNRRDHSLEWHSNFWWIEVGGLGNTIADTEKLRDELLKIAFGVWDHIKNRGNHGAANWALDWIGFLPGKRESRRYVGDHILTQNDIRSGGLFSDCVAYGGWPMDDHHPAGFQYPGEPTIFHPAPSPYGIPYRCLYSRNMENLFCAGRNISVTHAAMSSTRVMATCATLGQAVGTAAALATRHQTTPRGVFQKYMPELQDALQEDDCYLPGRPRTVAPLTLDAELKATAGNPAALRNGWDRADSQSDNAWTAPLGESATYSFDHPVEVKDIRLVFDSHMTNERPYLACLYPLNAEPFHLPESMVRAFRVDVTRPDGVTETVKDENVNLRRLVRIPVNGPVRAVRLTPLATWGKSGTARIFSFEIR